MAPTAACLLRIEPVGDVIARRWPVPRRVTAAIIRIRAVMAVIRPRPVIVLVMRMGSVVPDAIPMIISVETSAASLGNLNDVGRLRRERCWSGRRGIGRSGTDTQPDSAYQSESFH